MDKTKRTVCGILVFLFVGILTTAYITGYKNGNKVADTEYRSRFTELTDINRRLQDKNRELEVLNQSITERSDAIIARLGTAADIAGELGTRSEDDSAKIRRVIVNYRRLAEAVQILIENDKDK